MTLDLIAMGQQVRYPTPARVPVLDITLDRDGSIVYVLERIVVFWQDPANAQFRTEIYIDGRQIWNRLTMIGPICNTYEVPWIPIDGGRLQGFVTITGAGNQTTMMNVWGHRELRNGRSR